MLQQSLVHWSLGYGEFFFLPFFEIFDGVFPQCDTILSNLVIRLAEEMTILSPVFEILVVCVERRIDRQIGSACKPIIKLAQLILKRC